MKLGTRLIIFSSLFLLMLPWFGWHFIGKIEQSLLQGQEEAQSMVASAIATVLGGYSEVFDIDENALYVYPVNQAINIDGYDEDWGALVAQATDFADGKFSLLMANDTGNAENEYLYLFLSVADDDIVYRNPRYTSPDSSDHIRLEYIDTDNQLQRIVLLAEGQGTVNAYRVEDDWTTWQDGQYLRSIQGVLRETTTGYVIEMRVPVAWLEPEKRLSLSIVDVYSINERYPDTIVTTGDLDTDTLNPLLFQSQEIKKVLSHLSQSDTQICVIDRHYRVHAMTDGNGSQTTFCDIVDKHRSDMVTNVLQATIADVTQIQRITDHDETLIVAASPVIDEGIIIGAVLVSKNSHQILSLQRDTLMDVMKATVLMFLLVFFSLLFFSWWLAYRINRLKKQTASLIDERGRLVTDITLADVDRRDEIGELSRSFSLLLEKLNNYTRFLESVPRMLRHEILNPINTISMSLQSLKQDKNQLQTGSNQLNFAKQAILQLQLIVSSLTEAANIEEALRHDDFAVLDIAALLDEYVANLQLRHKSAVLRYYGADEGVFINGNDIRLVQLLDKIKDNALDFAINGSEIGFYLEQNSDHEVVIRIVNAGETIPEQRLVNAGETIPEQRLDLLFQGMVSMRADNSDTPHLGIGLYVAHQIALFHHGQLKITNRIDKQGVEVILILPVVNRQPSSQTTHH